MTRETSIRVNGLCKDYKLYRSKRDVLLERLTRRPLHNINSALKDVDLTVYRGEVVGIMGPNGAGKSTLLKLINGTLKPTRGTIEVRGRVSAILELGTGFAPLSTGRENLYMGCLCLGMRPDEIKRKMDDIIAFAGIEDAIDRSFHSYSTGMQARLAFSVAISPDPEVLIVDEALSVGDARFQQKCFDRIRALRDAGTTILLVSHDENSISSFCDRAIILMKGEKVAEGDVSRIVPEYHRLLFGSSKKSARSSPFEAPSGEQRDAANESAPAETDAPEVNESAQPQYSTEQPTATANTLASLNYGTGEGELIDCGILDERGSSVTTLKSGSRYRLFFRFRALVPLEDYTLGFAVRDRRATVLWGITTVSQNVRPAPLKPGEIIDCVADVTMWLAEGDYSLTFGAAQQTGEKIAFSDLGVPFKVFGPGGIFTTSVVNLEQRFDVRRLTNAPHDIDARVPVGE